MDEAEFMKHATNLCYAAMDMKDADVTDYRLKMHGINDLWILAMDIAEHGPRNDMEQRIVAHAVARRLEGQ